MITLSVGFSLLDFLLDRIRESTFSLIVAAENTILNYGNTEDKRVIVSSLGLGVHDPGTNQLVFS